MEEACGGMGGAQVGFRGVRKVPERVEVVRGKHNNFALSRGGLCRQSRTRANLLAEEAFELFIGPALVRPLDADRGACMSCQQAGSRSGG